MAGRHCPSDRRRHRQTLVVVPYDRGDQQRRDGPARRRESVERRLPGTDAYAIVLSKAPTGTVTLPRLERINGQATAQLFQLDGTATLDDELDLVFTSTTDWNSMQIIRVTASTTTIAQGLHFSRINQGVDAADADAFLGITAADVAAGLAAPINGDPTGRFTASPAR